MRIEASVALVTGANRGIGRSLVASLIRAGASRVYATARNLASLDAVVAMEPRRIVPLALDVTNDRDIEAATKAAPDVSLLINNAGVLASYNVLSSSKPQLEQDLAVNFFGTLAVVKAFLPALERANGAAIVNVLTVVSLASRPVIGGYAASKAAAFSLTQSLRAELKAKNIDVHAAIPGAVDTDMIRDFPIAKTSPEAVADAIVAGVGRGEEDILTDPMAKAVFERWRENPKELERYFGSL
jgi:NAD(P)-dependent dehydrogenase (short-subunit alcohol dehydrogenase family)